jgi:hypothetical protein
MHIVGENELVELAFGLPAEVRAIHKEKDALCVRMLDQPVSERAGGKGLAGTGGHLDKGARTGVGEGAFEAGDCFDLARAHSVARKWVRRWHPGETRPQRFRSVRRSTPTHRGSGCVAQPSRKRFGTVKRKNLAGTRLWVILVAKERFNPGGLIKEAEFPRRERSKKLGKVFRVVTGLIRYRGEGGAFLLCLHDADRNTIDEQQVIAPTRFQRDFPERDAASGSEIQRLILLDHPSTLAQHPINCFASLRFRGHGGRA